MCMCGNRLMKPIKIVFKREKNRVSKSNSRGEFDQSTLHACMEILQ
jgi:hypothetical protein